MIGFASTAQHDLRKKHVLHFHPVRSETKTYHDSLARVFPHSASATSNRPFPSSLVPLFQSESKCETIVMKMTLICMKMKLHAELIFALRLVLKQRHKRTRKWPITTSFDWVTGLSVSFVIG